MSRWLNKISIKTKVICVPLVQRQIITTAKATENVIYAKGTKKMYIFIILQLLENFFRNTTHSTILKREESSANLSKIVNRMGNVLMQNIPKIMFLSEDNDKYLSTNKP